MKHPDTYLFKPLHSVCILSIKIYSTQCRWEKLPINLHKVAQFLVNNKFCYQKMSSCFSHNHKAKLEHDIYSLKLSNSHLKFSLGFLDNCYFCRWSVDKQVLMGPTQSTNWQMRNYTFWYQGMTSYKIFI